jgi:hypothetical protein
MSSFTKTTHNCTGEPKMHTLPAEFTSVLTEIDGAQSANNPINKLLLVLFNLSTLYTMIKLIILFS